MRRFILLAAVALLAAAMIAGCSRLQSAANVSSASNRASSNAPNTQPDNVRRVTITELKQALEQDKAILIDVRGDAAYNQEHIKGALGIPESQLVARASEFPKDKLIVLYCS